MSGDLSLLFTDTLAQAIAEGRKTVTRRPIASANSTVWLMWPEPRGEERTAALAKLYIRGEQFCPRGRQHGSTVVIPGSTVNKLDFPPIAIRARALIGDTLVVRECWRSTGTSRLMFRGRLSADAARQYRWRPSIHMPRWAARSVRRIVSVTPERIAPLTDDEARAEGFDSPEEFAEVWAGLYGDRVRWAWRYEFEGTNA